MLENLDTVIAFSVVMLLLSLMITALVQMVVSLTALRGKNLAWGVERLLRQVDPKLGLHAKEIADRLLRHPAVTHTPMSRAVAIRPEELIRVLRQLADPPDVADDPMKKLSAQAQKLLKERMAAMSSGADAAVTTLQLDSIAAELRRMFPQHVAAMDAAVREVASQGDAMVQRINVWFDSLMDRTSERFKLYTRYITVGVTVVFVFVLHVNSISIFRQVSTNPEIRAQLVESRDAALGQAEGVFVQTGKGSGAPLASQTLQTMSEAEGDLGQRIKAECEKATAAGEPGCSSGLRTREEGRRWIAARLPDQADALEAYGTAFDKVAEQNIKDLGESMTKLRGDLEQTQLQIFPQELSVPELAEIPGLFTSILLLSLGAPFWYNVLRKLSDLRPIVARRVEGEAPKAAG